MNSNYVFQVLDSPPSQLRILLPPIFQRLTQRDEDPTFLETYARAIKMRISGNVNFAGYTAFDEFSTIAVQSGLVKSMMSLTQINGQDKLRGSAAYQAGDTFARLMISGTLEERRSLLKEMLKHDGVAVVLEKISHPLCIHRQLSANLMRTLTTMTFLGEYISGQRAADIMERFCQYTLDGPDDYVNQLTSPALTWQCEIAVGRQLTLMQARQYAPRYYALSQENAAWTLQGMLCRHPPPTYQFRLDCLRHKPQVLDLLFQCAALPTEAWYPENQHDSVACETLSMFFMPSLDHIPGVPIALRDDLQAVEDADAEAFSECAEILFSRDNWVERIVSVVKRLDEEKWQDIQQLFKRVGRDHMAVQTPDEESFRRVFEYRGTSRISILRLITALSYSSNTSLISDADLLALLRIAYMSCQRAQSAKSPASVGSQQDLFATIQTQHEILREPMYAQFVPQHIDLVQVIPPEHVMGPLAMARIITLLAQRDLLKKIPSWQRLPDGTSKSVSLRQVQQITSDSVIEKTLKYAMRMTSARREKGTARMKEGETENAGATYMSSAELAAALLALDEATKGKWGSQLAGARTELVKSLGNASEMAFQRGQYRRALRFATGAVSIAEAAPSSKPVDLALVAKNKRRVEACQSHAS